MKRFGYFVRLGGDAEISEALARGAQGALQPLPGSSSEAVRRVAMMRHTPEEWLTMTREARRKYRRNRRPTGMGKIALQCYALVCYTASLLYGMLWDAIEDNRTTRKEVHK